MSHDERGFERIATRTIHEGRIITVTDETYRYADGKTADREIVRTTGAAAIVAVDDEHVHVFLAEGLSEAEGEHDSGEDERIEIVRWPLRDLDGALEAVSDSKTIIGLLLYERREAS